MNKLQNKSILDYKFTLIFLVGLILKPTSTILKLKLSIFPPPVAYLTAIVLTN